MTKHKLKTEVDKARSSLQKDINRLKRHCNNYKKRAEDFKIWVKQANKFFQIMLKDGRITEKELSKYFKKRSLLTDSTKN